LYRGIYIWRYGETWEDHEKGEWVPASVAGDGSIGTDEEGGKLKERFEYMTVEKSKSRKQAIVAIGRRLAELLYTLMRDGTKHESRPFIREGKKAAEELAKLAMSA